MIRCRHIFYILSEILKLFAATLINAVYHFFSFLFYSPRRTHRIHRTLFHHCKMYKKNRFWWFRAASTFGIGRERKPRIQQVVEIIPRDTLVWQKIQRTIFLFFDDDNDSFSSRACFLKEKNLICYLSGKT